MTETQTRPSGALTRLGGGQAIAAAAPAAFAPLAVMALSIDDAPLWAAALVVVAAAPLVGLAGLATGRAAPAWSFAAATAPLIAATAFFTWTSGGALSPAAPWAFAALLAAAVVGGARSAAFAGLAAAALVLALAFAPDPPIRFLGFQPRDQREMIAAISWGGAAAAAAAAVWAALTSWARALPPLRHPTIAARQALSILAQAGEVCALRIDRDGRITQSIGAPEATLAIDREALRGMNVETITHPDDQEVVAALLGDPARRIDAADPDAPPPEDRAAARLTVRMHSKLGGFRWIEAEAWPGDAAPRPPGGPESADDALLVLRARWRPGAEVEDLADPEREGFLAHVNGDLRSAVKSVVGYTEILKNELFGPLGADRYRDYASRAHEGGAQLLEMIDELLDLAAIEAGRFAAQTERVDPAPLADGAMRLVRARAEDAGVALAVEVAPNTPHIVADRRALRRVLVNMMLDAIARGRMGDVAKLRVEAEEDAVRFQLIAVARPSAVGAFPATHGTAEDPASEGFGAPIGSRDDPALRGRVGEARLGRMVASNLAERMGGSVMFASPLEEIGADPGFTRGAGGRESVYAEAILPVAPPVSDPRDAAAAKALAEQRAETRTTAEDQTPKAPTPDEPDEADVPMFELGQARPRSAKPATTPAGTEAVARAKTPERPLQGTEREETQGANPETIQEGRQENTQDTSPATADKPRSAPAASDPAASPRKGARAPGALGLFAAAAPKADETSAPDAAASESRTKSAADAGAESAANEDGAAQDAEEHAKEHPDGDPKGDPEKDAADEGSEREQATIKGARATRGVPFSILAPPRAAIEAAEKAEEAARSERDSGGEKEAAAPTIERLAERLSKSVALPSSVFDPKLADPSLSPEDFARALERDEAVKAEAEDAAFHAEASSENATSPPEEALDDAVEEAEIEAGLDEQLVRTEAAETAADDADDADADDDAKKRA
ncbi:MAG: HAMP domain-containing sensor histidine kinase [Pseudomonadota bacterium]